VELAQMNENDQPVECVGGHFRAGNVTPISLGVELFSCDVTIMRIGALNDHKPAKAGTTRT
jgi:hypothetical protein